MRPDDHDRIPDVVDAVLGSRRYRAVSRPLVERLARQEIVRSNGSVKDAAQRTKRRLHQIFGSFLPHNVRYSKLFAALGAAAEHGPEALEEALLRAMKTHASTAERLSVLDEFCRELSQRVGTASTILDLGCGMQPLALPWFDAARSSHYVALDIDSDLVGFVGQCLTLMNADAEVGICDLVTTTPEQECDLALLLKMVPSLERQAQGRGIELIGQLRARIVAVSFPTQTLCSRDKGMRENYSDWFERRLDEHGWSAERRDLATELLYLVETRRG